MVVYSEMKIGIHIEKFRNIELFRQGLYQVRIKVFYSLDTLMCFAEPKEL